jgi:hypothetical protein
MFPRLCVTVLLLSSCVLPAAAGMRDTPLCKQDYNATLASFSASAARVQRAGSGKTDEACVAYRTHFLNAVKTRLVVAQCVTGPERDQDLGKLDNSVNLANEGIASRCG